MQFPKAKEDALKLLVFGEQNSEDQSYSIHNEQRKAANPFILQAEITEWLETFAL